MNEQKRRVAPAWRDLCLIFALLLLAGAFLLVFFLGREAGESVRVQIDGVTVAEYALKKDAVYSLNGGTNILVIEDGAAFIKEADCPDGTCVRVGRVRHTGERIVCLPNRITVTVIGGKGDVELTV